MHRIVLDRDVAHGLEVIHPLDDLGEEITNDDLLAVGPRDGPSLFGGPHLGFFDHLLELLYVCALLVRPVDLRLDILGQSFHGARPEVIATDVSAEGRVKKSSRFAMLTFASERYDLSPWSRC